METIERLAREHGTGGWQTLEDMVNFGKAVAEHTKKECAGVAFRHAKAHEQASDKATSDSDRDLSVNMSLAADAVGQAILATSNA